MLVTNSSSYNNNTQIKAGKAAKKRFENSTMDYNLLGVAWMIVELLLYGLRERQLSPARGVV